MDAAALHAKLMELLHLPREQATVEFRENLQDAETIGQYLSALANTAALERKDHAWMVLGVADGSHQIVGTNFDPYQSRSRNGPLLAQRTNG